MHRLKKDSNENSKGQGLIIVALVIFVLLLIILRAIADTLTDVSVSTGEEQSTRAFSAAQAGVEKAFFLGSGAGTFESDLGNNARYVATVTSVGEGQTQYNFPYGLVDGESSTLWFVSHDGNDLKCDEANGFPCFNYNGSTNLRLRVCFGELGSSVVPAVEVAIYYDSNGNSGVDSDNFSGVNVLRRAYDPDTTRNNSNNFANASLSNCSDVAGDTDADYDYRTPYIDLDALIQSAAPGCVTTSGCLLTAKIRVLYNDATEVPVGVIVTGDTLPSQANKVDSVGIVGGATGDTTTRRRLEAYQSFPELPPIFDAGVFSPPGIEKN